ncbi:MAG: exodeoxyribonuclease VII large subunit, partial [Gemmatimonadota bacterium]|nr:exodeoxyribonuclease VII large subunit [Gemmatimonadota bacterium]
GARALAREAARRHHRVRTRFDHLAERLGTASPLAILERGYAVVHAPDGSVVTDAGDLAVGEALEIRLARGRATAEVTDVEPEEEP